MLKLKHKIHLYMYFVGATTALLINNIFTITMKSALSAGSFNYWIPTIVFCIISAGLFVVTFLNFWTIFRTIKSFTKWTIIKEILCGIFYILFFVFSIAFPYFILNNLFVNAQDIKMNWDTVVPLLFVFLFLFFITNYFYISFVNSAVEEHGLGNDGIKKLRDYNRKNKKDKKSKE